MNNSRGGKTDIATVDENDPVVRTARRALDGFAEGNRTGDWRAYLDTLTDGFTFYVPGGPFAGKNTGRERAAAFARFISEEEQARLNFSPPFSTTRNGQTVVFEFEDEGTIRGRPVRNRLAFAYVVRGDKVSECREYVGVIQQPSGK